MIHPKVTLATIQDDGWDSAETEEAAVTYKGLHWALLRYVWGGLVASATVSKTSQIPWDNNSVCCTRCHMEGHLSWDCNKPPQCNKCHGRIKNLYFILVSLVLTTLSILGVIMTCRRSTIVVKQAVQYEINVFICPWK